jgi:hypothetical protein
MLFNIKRHESRKFNYIPRFYDKKAEQLKREKIIKGEDSNSDFSERLHMKLQENRKLQRKSTTRILVWIALLALLLYFMLS